jgi:hypothetical protein
MFCWPCIIVYQYNETNVMHFSFSLLRIKDLYMFRTLLAYSQEVLHKQHSLCCVRVMSVGCGTSYARSIPSVFCAAPPEGKQVTLKTSRDPWSSINWMKKASRRFHYTELQYCCRLATSYRVLINISSVLFKHLEISFLELFRSQ